MGEEGELIHLENCVLEPSLEITPLVNKLYINSFFFFLPSRRDLMNNNRTK